MTARRPSDSHRRFDLDVEHHGQLDAERRHAAALCVVSRFDDEPEVARELLDMLGLLAPPSVSVDPAPGPDVRLPSPRRGR